MRNENCLQGMRCPECGALEPFRCATVCSAVWTDDGVEDYTNPEIDPDCRVTCLQCQHVGDHDTFAVQNQPVVEITTMEFMLRPGEYDQLLDLLSDLRDDHQQTIVEYRVLPRGEEARQELIRGAEDFEAELGRNNSYWALSDQQIKQLRDGGGSE